MKIFFVISSFSAGFILMVLEILSARIMAPIIGSSVYTWTSVIGMMLLGLAIGAYMGGRLIDRFPNAAMLSLGFALSAFSTALIPVILPLSNNLNFSELGILYSNILLAGLLFLLPAFFLGTLQPMILKLYADRLSDIGREYGLLSAAWSLGSILGVFFTGFYLVSHWGGFFTLRTIAVVLIIFAFIFAMFIKKRIKLFLVCFAVYFIVAMFMLGSLRKPASQEHVLYQKTSDYYEIRVVDGEFGVMESGRMLFLDFDSHNFYGNNMRSIYTDIAPVFKYLVPNIASAYFLGGGAYLIPGEFARLNPKVKTIVSEIDEEVTKTAEKYFDLDRSTLTTLSSDGRSVLRESDKKYDVIMNDGFSSFISMPFYLATREMNELVKSRLSENGIYVINIISPLTGKASAWPKSFLKTFSLTFPKFSMAVFGNSFDDVQNILIFAAKDARNLDLALSSAIDAELNKYTYSARILPQGKYTLEEGTILTDDFAPTEALTISLVQQYFPIHMRMYRQLFPEGYLL